MVFSLLLCFLSVMFSISVEVKGDCDHCLLEVRDSLSKGLPIDESKVEDFVIYDWRKYENGCFNIKRKLFRLSQPNSKKRYDWIFDRRQEPVFFEVDVIYSLTNEEFFNNHDWNSKNCHIEKGIEQCSGVRTWNSFFRSYSSNLKALLIDMKDTQYFWKLSEDWKRFLLKGIADVVVKYGFQDRAIFMSYHLDKTVSHFFLTNNLRYGFKNYGGEGGFSTQDYLDLVDKLVKYPLLELYCDEDGPSMKDPSIRKKFSENGIAYVSWSVRQGSSFQENDVGYIAFDQLYHLWRNKEETEVVVRWCYRRSRYGIQEDVEVLRLSDLYWNKISGFFDAYVDSFTEEKLDLALKRRRWTRKELYFV